MANKYRGEIELAADGKTYTLRLGVNEQAAFEQEMGIESLIRAMAENKLGIGRLRTLTRLALSRHHGNLKLTDEQVGDIIDASGGMVEMISRLMESMKPLSAGDEGPKPEAAGTGPVSSPQASAQG